MRKLFMLLLVQVFLPQLSRLRKFQVSVKDEQGKGLEKTTVSLLRAKDSVSCQIWSN